MKKILNIIFFLAITLQSFALSAPSLRCISVINNGNISLGWTIPANITGFNSYHIFRSATYSGVYIKIDSIFNVNQTTYLDVGVNANNQSFFYYIQCRSTSNIYTSTSDTLQSIHLVVTNTGNGLANLVWNSIHQPPLITSSSYYQIYKSNSLLISWLRVDSVQSLQYIDTVKVCHDTIYYRVEVKDASNCFSVSSVDGKLFEDHTAPITNGMDTVSVNHTNGKVIIGWNPSPSLDTWGYIICHGSPCIALDTVYGRLNTSYIDSLNDPCSAAQTYRIAAFDSCSNTSLFSNNHNSILLSSQLNICANTITLNWTPYINLNPVLSGYRILMNKNGGNFNVISTNSPASLNYTFNNIEDTTTYCFYVQAFESTFHKTSSSCKKCYQIKKSLNPKFLYIRSVTVVSDNQMDVKIHTDPTVFVTSYQVFRSKSSLGVFSKIATLAPTVNADFTYIDYAVNTATTVYYYKILSTDSCENPGITSNISHTILLKGISSEGYLNKLEWSDYGDWAGNVASYSLYRTMNGSTSLKVADIPALLPGSIYQYSDDIQNFASSNGIFSYYVKAIENPNSIYNFVEESNSNEVEMVQAPEIFVPNAFVPEGVNKEFKPVTAFINSENYLMQIYNRFGQLIFENNNPEVGWDGKYKGDIVLSGVYVYLIRYSKPNHDIAQKKGIVTVVN
ncbi:MAG: gliding motility-associated C-terminal domain-containing protein [Bacteroidales bacterium]